MRESWIERAARLDPAGAAVEDAAGRATNAELARAASAIAAELARRGLTAGASVGIEAAGTSAFAAALHGCLAAGVVAVPLDGRLSAQQREARRARTDAVLGLDEIAELVAGGAPPLGRPSGGGGRRALAGVGADAATPAVLLFTSGTTGPGTPVLLSRGNLLWNALGSAAALGQPRGERWLSAMPVAHVGGLTVLTRSAIGATTAVLRPRFDVDEQTRLLMSGAGTITSVVPTMLARLLRGGLERPARLRTVLLGGGPIPPALLEEAASAGIRTESTYGMTEATSQVVTGGRPLFCTEVVLRGELTPERTVDEAAAAGPADELLVRGPTVAAGARGPGGWLETGDRGLRLGDGALAVAGRIAETIVTGGENVAPTEVEAQLLALPSIEDAAVLGVSDPEWGERIEARVVLAAGAQLDEQGLRSALREALPSFAVPKRISAVDALPRTPTGKLRRGELR